MAFRPLSSFIPTADELLSLDLPRLGRILLLHLKSYEGLNTVLQHGRLNRDYFIAILEGRNVGLGQTPHKEAEYGVKQPEVIHALVEAWNWLEREGLLIRDPHQPADWFVISRRGEELLKNASKFEQWEKLGLDRVRSDLIQTGGIRDIGGPQENRDLAWRSVRMKEAQATSVGKQREDKPVPRSVTASAALRPASPELDSEKRTVFVIHGRDERLRAGMFDFLRSLDLKPLEWTEAVKDTGKGSPYIGEILDAAFSRAQAVVVLFTPDDEARLRAALRATQDPSYEIQLTPQARPNVLFEAGMAMARDPGRTILVQIGELRPFSDIGGRHTIRMDNSPAKRHALVLRLQAAGCAVNLSGTDWQKAGDLTPPIIQAAIPSSRPAMQFTRSRVMRIAQAGYGLWIEDQSHGIQAVVLEFTNEAQAGALNAGAIVKSSLVYSDDRGERLRVSAGCWINEQTDLCQFRVEDTHALLVAFISGQQPSTVSKRRKYGDMGAEIVQIDEHTLAGFQQGFVRVRLTNADSGDLLYEGDFDLSFNPLRIVPRETSE